MSGYFARLMTQTGVGVSRSAPVPATVARPSLTEESSTVTAHTPQPNAIVDAAPRPAPPQDTPADSPSVPSPSAAPPQFALTGPSPAPSPEPAAPIEAAPPQETAEESRDTGFESAKDALDWLSARSLPSDPASAMEHLSEVTGFHITEVAPSETRIPSQAETRHTETAPMLRLSQPVEDLAAPAASQATAPAFMTEREGSTPHMEVSESPPLRKEVPQFFVPRETPSAPSERQSVSPRAATPAPSVRIDSIQIDVHSAPPPVPATAPAQPAPETPPAARVPSMRRFYMRSW